MTEERSDIMPKDQEVARRVHLPVGLSPAVERMFGALVDSGDEAEGDKAAELEEKVRPGAILDDLDARLHRGEPLRILFDANVLLEDVRAAGYEVEHVEWS